MGRLSGERFECPPPLLPQKAGFESDSVGDAAAESASHDRLIAERERLGPANLVAADELAVLAGERDRNAAEIDELRSAEHTSEHQPPMRTSSAVLRLKTTLTMQNTHLTTITTP